MDSPGATRQQVTFFQEPLGSISTNPNNSSIAFTMDKGGTENAQIYLLDTDNGESSKRSPCAPTGAPGSI